MAGKNAARRETHLHEGNRSQRQKDAYDKLGALGHTRAGFKDRIAHFQKHHDLAVTGKLDKKTAARIDRAHQHLVQGKRGVWNPKQHPRASAGASGSTGGQFVLAKAAERVVKDALYGRQFNDPEPNIGAQGANYVERDHPRWPSGTPGIGGQWRPKGMPDGAVKLAGEVLSKLDPKNANHKALATKFNDDAKKVDWKNEKDPEKKTHDLLDQDIVRGLWKGSYLTGGSKAFHDTANHLADHRAAKIDAEHRKPGGTMSKEYRNIENQLQRLQDKVHHKGYGHGHGEAKIAGFKIHYAQDDGSFEVNGKSYDTKGQAVRHILKAQGVIPNDSQKKGERQFNDPEPNIGPNEDYPAQPERIDVPTPDKSPIPYSFAKLSNAQLEDMLKPWPKLSDSAPASERQKRAHQEAEYQMFARRELARRKKHGGPTGAGVAAALARADARVGKAAIGHEPVGTHELWHTPGIQLPAYIQHIANDLIHERGMSKSHAIATAVSRCKVWAAGGGGVTAETQAKAAAAIAEWEKLKASHVGKEVGDGEVEKIRHVTPSNWDPSKHPRNTQGEFTNALHHLMAGTDVTLPHSGVRVSRGEGSKRDHYTIHHGELGQDVRRGAGPAAARALAVHAKRMKNRKVKKEAATGGLITGALHEEWLVKMEVPGMMKTVAEHKKSGKTLAQCHAAIDGMDVPDAKKKKMKKVASAHYRVAKSAEEIAEEFMDENGDPVVKEAVAAKPAISTEDSVAIAPVVAYYRKKSPDQCVKDQTSNGIDVKKAKARCGVIQDLIHGLGWRKSDVAKAAGMDAFDQLEWEETLREMLDENKDLAEIRKAGYKDSQPRIPGGPGGGRWRKVGGTDFIQGLVRAPTFRGTGLPSGPDNWPVNPGGRETAPSPGAQQIPHHHARTHSIPIPLARPGDSRPVPIPLARPGDTNPNDPNRFASHNPSPPSNNHVGVTTNPNRPRPKQTIKPPNVRPPENPGAQHTRPHPRDTGSVTHGGGEGGGAHVTAAMIDAAQRRFDRAQRKRKK